VAAGIANPVSQVAIQYGLIEAASRNPLQLPQNEVEPLIRLALFDDTSDSRPSPELYDEIVERIMISFEAHDAQGSDAFNKWFSGAKG